MPENHFSMHLPHDRLGVHPECRPWKEGWDDRTGTYMPTGHALHHLGFRVGLQTAVVLLDTGQYGHPGEAAGYCFQWLYILSL